MYREDFNKVCRKIEYLIILGKIKPNSKIFMFGASENTRQIIGFLRNKNIKVTAVLDNDSKKENTFCNGVIVKLPSKSLGNDGDSTFIICSFFNEEMIRQLNKLGYKKNIINLLPDKILRKSFFDRMLVLNKGHRIYNKILKKYGDDYEMFFCPYIGTGDIYLIGSFWEAFIKKNNIKKYVFIVVSKACESTAKIYGIKNIERISRKCGDHLAWFNLFAPEECKIKILNDSWGEFYTNYTERLRGIRGLDFAKMFKFCVFDLPDNCVPKKPKAKPNYNNVRKIFKEKNLIEGKTVVLSPYANTLSDLSEEFWIKLADRLRDMGFVVCTNSCGAYEPVIEGTIGVFFPLLDTIPFLNLCGYFIGVRSGFCDIASASSAKKIILYDKNNYFFEVPAFEYFSLAKMGLCNDATEIMYSFDGEDKCLEDIIKAIDKK